MTKAEILSDLDYVKTLAEEGRNAPLLGGRFGVMWGLLLAIAFTGHWLVVSGAAGLSYTWLTALWLSFGIMGSLGCVILGKSLIGKAGAAATGNRAEQFIWTSFSLTMFICFAGVFTNMALNKGTTLSFDLMLVLGWAGQGAAYLSVARISGDKRLRVPAVLSIATAFTTLVLYGDAVIYLIGAISAVFSIVLPGLSQMRREPSDVV